MSTENHTYREEVRQRWGSTEAYKEYTQRAENTAGNPAEGLDAIMAEFAACKAGGKEPSSPAAMKLVKALQDYITEHFYTCTDEILLGLGQMYVADERFKENIDKHGSGTAEYIQKAICRKGETV